MLKNLLTISVVVIAFVTVGCAHVQSAAEKYIPTVEAKAGAAGIGLKIDPKFGFETFCLDPVGTVAGVLSKIPVIGSLTTDVVGVCDEEETVSSDEGPVE